MNSGIFSTIGWNDILQYLFLMVYAITVLSTVFAIVMEKRDPHKTLAWVLLILLVPILGIVWYLVFGQNYRKRKMFSRKGLIDLARIRALSEDQLLDLSNRTFHKNSALAGSLNIIKLLLKNSKALLTQHNRVDILNDGLATFEAMLSALERAEHHIHLDFFKIADDEIGNQVRRILVRKAREGVKVRIIYDDVGSWHLTRRYIRTLREAGAEILPFMPVRFPYFTSKVNFRNHRKILVIDGKVGFVGGLNIADKYLKGTRRFPFWRDTHLRLEGEAVRSLQTVFITDWYFVSGEIITHRKKYFPDYQVEETNYVQITASGPDSDWANIMQAFFVAITNARKNIYITTPYFSPNESILTALVTAALRGVDVRIILPYYSDSTVSYWNSVSYVTELLEAGIRVFLYKKGFIHAKLLMVDGTFSTVGSANMDMRSFDIDFEVNALIYSRKITARLESTFEEDMKNSVEVNFRSWKERPRRKKIMESLARMLGPLY